MTTCVPWQTDPGCTDEEWAAFPTEVQDRALALAWSAVRTLTGGQVGNCPVLARPCRQGCSGAAWDNGLPVFQPTLRNGFWFNSACGCGGSGCGCTAISEVVFPGPVAAVYGVWVGGAKVDPSAYRIDNGHRLVREDGDVWPLCQDLSQPWDGDNAFSVVYIPGVRPGDAGRAAAGILAYEFAKACTGNSKCRLPSSVTSIARQGVTMEFTQGMFAGGVTGIREVDAWVMGVNPHHLVQPSRVWSPDIKTPRYSAITWTLPPMPDEPGPFGWEFGIEFDVVPTP